MSLTRRARRATACLTALPLLLAPTATALAQPPRATQVEPQVGQQGKDVVWVPTPATLVDKMLDMAHVTSDDVVMDLGSGDGRNIIAAAKRGARAIGVEFSPELVTVSRRLAEEAGVSGKASFVEGDMYAADISKATVMALFLLPENLERLRDRFLTLAPGTRIVINTFAIPGWEPDAQETIPDCLMWCTAVLYVVPANVQGRWTTARGELRLEQSFQVVRGTLTDGRGSTPVAGRLRGADLELVAAGETLRGTVAGDRIDGGVTARRAEP